MHPHIVERNGRLVTAAPERFDPEPWRRELLAFVGKIASPRVAEDVVQDAFLRALESPPRSHPRAFLYRIALNALRDRGRGDRRALEALSIVAESHRRQSATDPASGAEARDLATSAWRAADALPEGQRIALVLRVHQHMSYEEIAVALDCTAATARQHFYLAVKAVRNALAPEDDDDVS